MSSIPELTDTVDAIMGFCPGYIINGESKRDGNSDFVTWLWAQDLDTIAAAIKPSNLRGSSEWRTEIQKAMEEAEAYATACGDF